jgi:hypothetical protein
MSVSKVSEVDIRGKSGGKARSSTTSLPLSAVASRGGTPFPEKGGAAEVVREEPSVEARGAT